MKSNLKQSFLAAFQILDEVFDDTRNEQLGNLLSEMNPYLFADLMSADPAIWNEWIDCAKKINKDEVYSSDEVFETLNIFLELNSEQYYYDMDLLLCLINDKITNGRWERIFKKALTIS
ncbi:MAG: hypothetical protein LBK75_04705 [Oscillospiraceae bacterium]|jgi:hypothetical protein|nr:hypothetical protein [Oscillospiraceae bacterium]